MAWHGTPQHKLESAAEEASEELKLKRQEAERAQEEAAQCEQASYSVSEEAYAASQSVRKLEAKLKALKESEAAPSYIS